MVVAGLLLGVPGAGATVLVDTPLDDMIVDAETIVLGEVARVGSRIVFEEGGPELWTVATIKVERWLKGSGSDTTVIEERGGQAADAVVRVAGTPTYRRGERVVIFSWRDPNGRTRTYGMALGKFVVRAGVGSVPTMVERSFEHTPMVHWSNGQMQMSEPAATEMRLSDLTQRIRQVLQLTGTTEPPRTVGPGPVGVGP